MNNFEIYDHFCDRMTQEDLAAFAHLKRWDCTSQVLEHEADVLVMSLTDPTSVELSMES